MEESTENELLPYELVIVPEHIDLNEVDDFGGEINVHMARKYVGEILRWTPEERKRKEAMLCLHLDKWLTENSIGNFCGYIAQNDPDEPDIEPDLHELYEKRTGNGLVLPGFHNGKPMFHRIDRPVTVGDVRENSVGALEPIPGRFPVVSAEEIDVVLVPGVEGAKMVYSRNAGYEHWNNEFPSATFLPVCLLYYKSFTKVRPKKEYGLIATPDGIIDPTEHTDA